MFKKFVLALVVWFASIGIATAAPQCTYWTPAFGCLLWLPSLIPGARWCSTPDESPGPYEIALYTNPNFNESKTWAYCMIVTTTPGQTHVTNDLDDYNWNGPQFVIQSIRIGTYSFATFHEGNHLSFRSLDFRNGSSLNKIGDIVDYTFGSFESGGIIGFPAFNPRPKPPIFRF